MRPITSYGKVQRVIGRILRGRILLHRARGLEKKWLNVGCGSNIFCHFLNMDFEWRPGIDLCWDIRSRLPFSNASKRGIFTEHCLEHVTYDECVRAVQEFHRVLEPGGVIRIVVPDGGLYLDLYQRSKDDGHPAKFPYVEEQGVKDELADSRVKFTPMMAVNRIFRGYGHLFAYDFETLASILAHAGFTEITQVDFRRGRQAELLIDSESRAPQSLYVEATKKARGLSLRLIP